MTKNLTTADGLELRHKLEEPNFSEEKPGWKGYIEWEKYPEKQKRAEEILAQYNFPGVSRHAFRVMLVLTPAAPRVPVERPSIPDVESASRGRAMETVPQGLGRSHQGLS